ncbi:MAG: AraC family transcriptional regulator [Parahaliea sp.]
MRNVSIPLHFVRCVLHNTVKQGLDPAKLLRHNRISPHLLHENNARISIERFADLQTSTMLAMEDESLGYASRRLPIGMWSMMCHAVISAETLGQALSRHCRFYQLFDLDIHPVLEVANGTAAIRLQQRSNKRCTPPCFAELTLANAHRFASWLIQEYLPLQRAQFSYAMPTQPADYHHIFLGNPVEFDREDCALIFSEALLEREIAQDEQSLRHFLRHPVLLLLTQRYNRDSWTTRVRKIAARDMLHMPELPEVASSLDLHPQTLRRRLLAEGVTFKEIKSQLRRDTALYYLGKQGLSIEEIAHRAGFSESSAFIRAFKNWTGVTPYSYRKGL